MSDERQLWLAVCFVLQPEVNFSLVHTEKDTVQLLTGATKGQEDPAQQPDTKPQPVYPTAAYAKCFSNITITAMNPLAGPF